MADDTFLPVRGSPSGAPGEPEAHDALRAGTRLDDFEIVRVLGAGGFGIVYLALDQVLLRHVAIKEYMPTALAGRGKGAMVSVRSAALVEPFALGLESFFNEARMLASFDHPSLVKVHRFWKANGTAYMVMQYYPGQTLKEARREMTAAPDEAWLLALVEALLGALEVLHGEGVYHRDISPDNILLLPDGRPVLLDFGSARRVIGDRTQALTAILKPSFAPVEQYADETSMRQGPWTDLYALGATLHFVLAGQAPTPAVLRAVRDSMPALSAPGGTLPGVRPHVLAAIDWALALAPQDRPQAAAIMRQALSGEIVPPPLSPRHAVVPRLTAESDDADDLSSVTTFDADSAANTGPKIAPISPLPISPLTPANEVLTNQVTRRAGLAALALVSTCVLGWGAWAPPDAPSQVEFTAIGITVPDSARPSDAVDTPITTAEKPSETAPIPVRVVRREPLSPLPAEIAKPVPRAPIELCGDLNFFAQAVCISRECQAPALSGRPQCVEAMRVAEQRKRRMEQ